MKLKFKIMWGLAWMISSCSFAQGYGVGINTSNTNTTTMPNNLGLEDEAFANTMRNMLPLSPEQIKMLHTLFDQSQAAAASYPGGIPPKPTSASVPVNLSPGATPPVVRLSQGFISSLVFLDATGAPWPINAIDVGDPKAFNVQWNKKSNTLLVQALDRYTNGNLAVILKGLNTPVMLTLIPGQRAIDYRVDLRIPRLGPKANPVLSELPAGENSYLVSVLDGIPPEGSKTVEVKGGGENCEAWLLGNQLFLRTDMTVLSPAWISTMRSSDGTQAYQLPVTPIVLAIHQGKVIKLKMQGL